MAASDLNDDDALTAGEFGDLVADAVGAWNAVAVAIRGRSPAHAAVDTAASAAFWVVAVVLAAVMAGVPLWEAAVAASTLAVGASFAIAGAVDAAVQGAVFVFARRPYDVGDVVLVHGLLPGGAGGRLRVVAVRLLDTVFERADGVWIMIPHTALARAAVSNLRRAGRPTVQIRLAVAFGTPPAAVARAVAGVEAYLAARPLEWRTGARLRYDDVSPGGPTKVTVEVEPLEDWGDAPRIEQSASRLRAWLGAELAGAGIGCEKVLQPVVVIGGPTGRRVAAAAGAGCAGAPSGGAGTAAAGGAGCDDGVGCGVGGDEIDAPAAGAPSIGVEETPRTVWRRHAARLPEFGGGGGSPFRASPR